MATEVHQIPLHLTLERPGWQVSVGKIGHLLSPIASIVVRGPGEEFTVGVDLDKGILLDASKDISSLLVAVVAQTISKMNAARGKLLLGVLTEQNTASLLG